MDDEVGGMQLPHVVAQACFAWFQAANVGTAAYPFLTMATANLLLAHGTPEQIDTYVRPMLEGRFFGTMCLSEPQAGSSLADVTTRAEPQADGTLPALRQQDVDLRRRARADARTSSTWCWPRSPARPAGVKGISLFIVPKFLVERDGTLGERNDVVLAGLNHKMGYRGTANTLLNFGEGRYRPGGRAGAVGYLVGEPHRGLAYMFHMMNEARIGVGARRDGARLHRLPASRCDYARERAAGSAGRRQGPASAAGADHRARRRAPDAAGAEVVRRRRAGARCSTAAGWSTRSRPPDAPRSARRAHLLLDVLTPIAKSWPSQWCLAANDLAIQVHGGYGYTRDYDVEQFYRDNRLNPIHEGTHGIQALDLLGRKVVADARRRAHRSCWPRSRGPWTGPASRSARRPLSVRSWLRRRPGRRHGQPALGHRRP